MAKIKKQKIKDRKTVKLNSERALDLYSRYKSSGTLEEVGRQVGVTRERVRQILRKGNSYGLFVYPEPTRNVPKEEILESINSGFSRKEMADCLGISIILFDELRNKYDISSEFINDAILNNRKKEVKKWYDNLVEVLGEHPSTSILQNTKKYRSQYARICNYWGNFTNFRNDFNIETKKAGDNIYINTRRLEAKMGYELIIKFLINNSASLSKIYQYLIDIDFNSKRKQFRKTFTDLRKQYVFSLVSRLQDVGIIESIGTNNTRAYKLTQDFISQYRLNRLNDNLDRFLM